MHVRKVNERAQNAYLYAPLVQFDQPTILKVGKIHQHLQKKPQLTKSKKNYARSSLIFQKKGKRKITDNGKLATDTQMQQHHLYHQQEEEEQ